MNRYKNLQIPDIALYKDECDARWQFKEKDDPQAFYDLTAEKQSALLEWCESLDKRKTVNPLHDSYNLKHLFSKGRFYIPNGAMKGALILAGFETEDTSRLNWCFNISEKSLKKEYKAKGYVC